MRTLSNAAALAFTLIFLCVPLSPAQSNGEQSPREEGMAFTLDALESGCGPFFKTDENRSIALPTGPFGWNVAVESNWICNPMGLGCIGNGIEPHEAPATVIRGSKAGVDIQIQSGIPIFNKFPEGAVRFTSKQFGWSPKSS